MKFICNCHEKCEVLECPHRKPHSRERDNCFTECCPEPPFEWDDERYDFDFGYYDCICHPIVEEKLLEDELFEI